MLSNSNERETGETVYAYSGTSALSPMTAGESAGATGRMKKRNKKRNRHADATYGALTVPSLPGTESAPITSIQPESPAPDEPVFPSAEPAAQPAIQPDLQPVIPPDIQPDLHPDVQPDNPPGLYPEPTFQPDLSPELQPDFQPQPQSEPFSNDYPSTDTLPEQDSQPITPAVTREAESRSVYIPMGTEYVRTDRELPQVDNTHTIPEGSGIIYEVAEELYRKEKTASEIEALCQPPFKKVFDQKQIEQLERQAQERTLKLLAGTSETNQRKAVEGVIAKEEKPLSTAGAFFLQLVLLIPVLNIIAALVFSFNKGINRNLKAYTRAFLIWITIGMTGALVYFAFSFYSNPYHYADLMKFLSLFSG